MLFLSQSLKNPKDKGPFPEYTLWYYKDELLKMEFKNPNDKKNTITIIRNHPLNIWSFEKYIAVIG